MKIVLRWILLLLLPVFAACEPEAPDLDACKRVIPQSTLTAIDTLVMAAAMENRFPQYVFTETVESNFLSLQNQGWNVDSITLYNADERSRKAGVIGNGDFEDMRTITRSEYNCIGNTLKLETGQALWYVEFSLPGYNSDSTEAAVMVSDGLWNFWNSSCMVILKKQGNNWIRTETFCMVQ